MIVVCGDFAGRPRGVSASRVAMAAAGDGAAVQAVGASPTDSVTELLDRIHRTESAAEMMKAGYWAAVDAAGRLTWNRG